MALDDTATPRQRRNWEAVRNYSMISPFDRASNLPASPEGIPAWSSHQQHLFETQTWAEANKQTRKIPTGKRLPPVFINVISPQLDRLAVNLYLNKIPHSAALSSARPHLTQLLARPTLTAEQVHQIENNLSMIAGASTQQAKKPNRVV